MKNIVDFYCTLLLSECPLVKIDFGTKTHRGTKTKAEARRALRLFRSAGFWKAAYDAAQPVSLQKRQSGMKQI